MKRFNKSLFYLMVMVLFVNSMKAMEEVRKEDIQRTPSDYQRTIDLQREISDISTLPKEQKITGEQVATLRRLGFDEQKIRGLAGVNKDDVDAVIKGQEAAVLEESAADIKKLMDAGYTRDVAEAIILKKPEARGVTVDQALSAPKPEVPGAKKDSAAGGIFQRFIQAFKPAPKAPTEAEATPPKPTATTPSRELSVVAVAETKAQKETVSLVTRLRNSAVKEINKWTQKIASGQGITTKDTDTLGSAARNFLSAIRGNWDSSTDSMKRSFNNGISDMQKGINSIIARIPVNSPQRRKMLALRGEVNFEYARAVEAALKENPDSLAARAENFRALDDMARSPASTKIHLSTLGERRTALQRQLVTASYEDIPKIRAEIDKINTDMTALDNLQKNRDAALESTRKLISDREGLRGEFQSALDKANQAVSDAASRAKLTAADLADPRKELPEEVKKALAEKEKLEKQIKDLDDEIGQAKKLIEPPESAFKRATSAIIGAAKGLTLPSKKDIAEAAKRVPGVTRLLAGIESARRALEKSAREGDLKRVGEALASLKKSAEDLGREINKLPEKAQAAFKQFLENLDGTRKKAESNGEEARKSADDIRRKIAEEAEKKKTEARELLGVKENATEQELAKAFRQKAVEIRKKYGTGDPQRDTALKALASAKALLTTIRPEADIEVK